MTKMLAVTGGMALCRPFQTMRLPARPHAVPSNRLQIVAARAKGEGKGKKFNNDSLLKDDKKGGKKLKKQKKQLKACDHLSLHSERNCYDAVA